MNELLQTIWVGISGSIWQILGTILVAVASFAGAKISEAYRKKADTQTKREIIKTIVEMVEQVAKSKGWTSEEKFAEARKNALQWLSNIGIKTTDIELEALIESTVNSFNQGFKKTTDDTVSV